MPKRLPTLIALIALFSLTFTESSLAFKPVTRVHPWEDLAGYAGSQYDNGPNAFRIYVISDPSRPCDNSPGGNKYKVRTYQLVGEEAFRWLESRGLAAWNYDGWQKTAAYHEWELAQKAGSLYWQACAGNTGTSESSQCGQQLSRYERDRYLNWLKRMYENSWQQKAVRTYSEYGTLKTYLLNQNYSSVWYQGNIPIWVQWAECWDNCIMNTPRDYQTNKQAAGIYRNCIKNCRNAAKFMKCP